MHNPQHLSFLAGKGLDDDGDDDNGDDEDHPPQTQNTTVTPTKKKKHELITQYGSLPSTSTTATSHITNKPRGDRQLPLVGHRVGVVVGY